MKIEPKYIIRNNNPPTLIVEGFIFKLRSKSDFAEVCLFCREHRRGFRHIPKNSGRPSGHTD